MGRGAEDRKWVESMEEELRVAKEVSIRLHDECERVHAQCERYKSQLDSLIHGHAEVQASLT